MVKCITCSVFAVVLVAPCAIYAQSFKQDRVPVRPGEKVVVAIDAAKIDTQMVNWVIRPVVPGLTVISSALTQATFDAVAKDPKKIAQIPAPPGPATITMPDNIPTATFTTTGGTLAITAPLAVFPSVGYSGTISIQANVMEKDINATLVLSGPEDPMLGGDIMASVIGFEQAGANSAESARKLFLDFFVSRPLPGWKGKDYTTFGPEIRWWGDVRIASYPQPISGNVADFITTFSTKLGNVPINEIAGFGEFRTGLDFRLKSLPVPFFPRIGASGQISSLSLIAYYGALGPMHEPTQGVPVFEIPTDQTTPQYKAFQDRFPSNLYPQFKLAGAKYVAFTAEDRNRFYHQYGAGFRLTTRFLDSHRELLPSPAMVTATFGQHELVSGGSLRGVAGKFEGFYPLPIASDSTGLSIYLFGRATMRLGGKDSVDNSQLLSLSRAYSSNKDASGNPIPIPITDPGVVLISAPGHRDLYTIGVGIDLANFIGKILHPTPSTTSASK